MHGLSFCFPLDLEIGLGVEEVVVCPWKDLEQLTGADVLDVVEYAGEMTMAQAPLSEGS